MGDAKNQTTDRTDYGDTITLSSGLHDKIDLAGIEDGEGDVKLSIVQWDIHTPAKIEAAASFCFKDIDQMRRLRDWLDEKINTPFKSRYDNDE